MKIRLTLIILYLSLSIGHVFAQDSVVDSLKIVVMTSEDDTIKVQNLISISQNLAGTDNRNAIYYGSRARNLAEDLNYTAGKAKALKYIGIGYYMQGDFVQTIKY